jgi:hypothetical protein
MNQALWLPLSKSSANWLTPACAILLLKSSASAQHDASNRSVPAPEPPLYFDMLSPAATIAKSILRVFDDPPWVLFIGYGDKRVDATQGCSSGLQRTAKATEKMFGFLLVNKFPSEVLIRGPPACHQVRRANEAQPWGGFSLEGVEPG